MHQAMRAHNNEYYGKNEDIYMNRKLTAAILCCMMVVLTACGGKGGKKEEESAAEAESEVNEETGIHFYHSSDEFLEINIVDAL